MRSLSGGFRRLALATFAAIVVLGAVVGPAVGAQKTADRPPTEDTTFVVALEEDGDATVTLRLTFDLDREEERRALARLRENRSSLAAEFGDGLGAVAARTADRTGREMRVSDPAVRVSTEGSTGVVELSATWVGLATVEDGRLVVSQPFSEEFRPPGRFEVRGPDGYELDAAAPASEATSGPAASWPAGTSLAGFEATFVPADSSTSQSLPGFGFPVGILAVGVVAGVSALAARRRS